MHLRSSTVNQDWHFNSQKAQNHRRPTCAVVFPSLRRFGSAGAHVGLTRVLNRPSAGAHFSSREHAKAALHRCEHQKRLAVSGPGRGVSSRCIMTLKGGCH